MIRRLIPLVACAAVAACRPAPEPPHNVVLFVADGLRAASVTPETAPDFARVRAEGVDFANSHAAFPTLTTVNAAALATGLYPGDSGDFGNVLYAGEPALSFPVGSTLAAVEDDETLGLLNARFGGNVLGQHSLLASARRHGLSTAVIGKGGPAALQDVAARAGETLVVDDETGSSTPGNKGLPLPAEVVRAMRKAGLAAAAPDRGLNTSPGAYNMPGALVPNREQQDWFVKVATQVVLPRFKAAKRPFLMVFWSRDPDGTQHNEGDSLGKLSPGVNGPTSLAAVRNASDDLGELRAALKRLGLESTTDIVVVADHGFSTLSKQSATSPSAKRPWRGVAPGQLPPGFLAVDLSLALGLKLHDSMGLEVDPGRGAPPAVNGALLGPDPKAPEVVVAYNGGSDLIWLPHGDAPAMARRIAAALQAQDYLGGLFVDDALGPVPGALPLSAIGLTGRARTPRPAMVVVFRSWSLGCRTPQLCAIEVADSTLQQGQGIHGSFSRADTHNFMAAWGPDFRRRFVDRAPVGNVDVPVTLARVLGLPAPAAPSGRVLAEALKGGRDIAATRERLRSAPGVGGFVTELQRQHAGGARYFDAAGDPRRTFGLSR